MSGTSKRRIEVKKTKGSIQNNAIIVYQYYKNQSRIILEILMKKISAITKHFGKTLSPFYRIK